MINTFMLSFKYFLIENNDTYFYIRAAIRHIPSGTILDGDRHSTAIRKAMAHYHLSNIDWGGNPDHPEGSIKMGLGEKFKDSDWEHGFLTRDKKFETRDDSSRRFGRLARDSEGLVELGLLPPYNTEVEEANIEKWREQRGI
jgi:hypothetical protein